MLSCYGVLRPGRRDLQGRTGKAKRPRCQSRPACWPYRPHQSQAVTLALPDAPPPDRQRCQHREGQQRVVDLWEWADSARLTGV